ncbi:hypothetical protein AVM15_03240 [Paraclostridium benzoelyticum]|nr:hypothetical protein AVM15_03240 [Paraclostridium benzoelyticum]
MRKYNIECTIRKANAYRRMIKSTKEHTVLPNLLNREFKQRITKKVLLTDITYLTYNNNKRSYLSTNEINQYIDYHNNYRYQSDLNKMTPTQYRDHLMIS